jgi:hypothetical protein
MKYAYKVTRNGGLCSKHKTEAAARKAVRRYVAMSRGKLTERDFKVEPNT